MRKNMYRWSVCLLKSSGDVKMMLPVYAPNQELAIRQLWDITIDNSWVLAETMFHNWTMRKYSDDDRCLAEIRVYQSENQENIPDSPTLGNIVNVDSSEVEFQRLKARNLESATLAIEKFLFI